MRRQYRVLDHMAHDLAARQHAHIHLLPVRQALARHILFATFERVADAGEVVTELPEAQRDIQHRNAPQHRKRPTQSPEQKPVDHQREDCRHHDGQEPGTHP